MFYHLLFVWICLLLVACQGQDKPVPAVPTIAPTSTSTAIPSPTVTPILPTVLPPTATLPTPTTTPSRLLSYIPATYSLYSVRPDIILTFNEPMDETTVLKALTIEPALPFTLQGEQATITMALQESLMPGVVYTVRLNQTAMSVSGRALEQTYEWQYQPQPLLNEASWPTIESQQTDLKLVFNYALDRAQFSSAFTIEPPVDGELVWQATSKTVFFVPAGAFDFNTQYTVHFRGPLLDSKNNGLGAPADITFTSPPPLASYLPLPNAQVDQPIAIQFDVPMDRATTEAAFELIPATPGRISWQDNTLLFTPDSQFWATNTTYTITLNIGALATSGRNILSQPFTYTFTTGNVDYITTFGWGNHLQLLDANGQRLLHFIHFSSEMKLVQFDLYAMSLPDFVGNYIGNYRGPLQDGALQPLPTPNSPPLRHWEQLTNLNGVELLTVEPFWAKGITQRTTIPADVPAGTYLLNLTSGALQDQLLIVISQNTMVATITSQQVLVWVTNINGNVVADADVTLYRGQEIIGNGKTDSNGLFLTELGELPTLITAGIGSDLTVVLPNSDQLILPLPNSNPYIIIADFYGRPVPETYQSIIWREGSSGVGYVDQYGIVGTFGQGDEPIYFGAGRAMPIILAENWLAFSNGWVPSWLWPPDVPDYAVSIVTSQPAYHAGQLLDFRGFVGQWNQGAIQMIPAGATITAQLRDPNMTLLDSLLVSSNDFGTVNGQFLLPAGLSRGEYALDLLISGESYRQFFMVEEPQNQAYQVTITPDATNYQETDVATVVVQVTDPAGQPMANAAVDLLLIGQTIRPYWTDVNPNELSWMYEQELTTTQTTDQNGQTTFRIDIGYFYFCTVCAFEATVTLPNGQIAGNMAVFTQNDTTTPWIPPHNNITIMPNKEHYTPGETAQLTVQSTFSGPALLTLGNGASLSSAQTIYLNQGQTTLTIPVEVSHTPLLYVNIGAWQPKIWNDSTIYNNVGPIDTQWEFATTSLPVTFADKLLTVSLTNGQTSYPAGQPATFTVHISDATGQPVIAELSFSLADQALFAAPPAPIANLSQSLYVGYPDHSYITHSMYFFRELGRGYIDGGPSIPFAWPRQQFADGEPFGFPAIVTDPAGNASLTIPLPNIANQWQLTLRAITPNGLVGQNFVSIITD